jgi:hypothetical protein
MIRGLGDQGAGGAGGGGAPDCGQMLKDWWANCPLFCKFIFTSCTGIYLFSWLWTGVLGLTYLSPASVLSEFQVWRLITAPFCNP